MMKYSHVKSQDLDDLIFCGSEEQTVSERGGAHTERIENRPEG